MERKQTKGSMKMENETKTCDCYNCHESANHSERNLPCVNLAKAVKPIKNEEEIATVTVEQFNKMRFAIDRYIPSANYRTVNVHGMNTQIRIFYVPTPELQNLTHDEIIGLFVGMIAMVE